MNDNIEVPRELNFLLVISTESPSDLINCVRSIVAAHKVGLTVFYKKGYAESLSILQESEHNRIIEFDSDSCGFDVVMENMNILSEDVDYLYLDCHFIIYDKIDEIINAAQTRFTVFAKTPSNELNRSIKKHLKTANLKTNSAEDFIVYDRLVGFNKKRDTNIIDELKLIKSALGDGEPLAVAMTIVIHRLRLYYNILRDNSVTDSPLSRTDLSCHHHGDDMMHVYKRIYPDRRLINFRDVGGINYLNLISKRPQLNDNTPAKTLPISERLIITGLNKETMGVITRALMTSFQGYVAHMPADDDNEDRFRYYEESGRYQVKKASHDANDCIDYAQKCEADLCLLSGTAFKYLLDKIDQSRITCLFLLPSIHQFIISSIESHRPYIDSLADYSEEFINAVRMKPDAYGRFNKFDRPANHVLKNYVDEYSYYVESLNTLKSSNIKTIVVDDPRGLLKIPGILKIKEKLNFKEYQSIIAAERHKQLSSTRLATINTLSALRHLFEGVNGFEDLTTGLSSNYQIPLYKLL